MGINKTVRVFHTTLRLRKFNFYYQNRNETIKTLVVFLLVFKLTIVKFKIYGRGIISLYNYIIFRTFAVLYGKRNMIYLNQLLLKLDQFNAL